LYLERVQFTLSNELIDMTLTM